jgi:hypothetical protein
MKMTAVTKYTQVNNYDNEDIHHYRIDKPNGNKRLG